MVLLNLAPLVGPFDCIVDIVETMKPWNKNGLEINPYKLWKVSAPNRK